jgi:hypothetical protein
MHDRDRDVRNVLAIEDGPVPFDKGVCLFVRNAAAQEDFRIDLEALIGSAAPSQEGIHGLFEYRKVHFRLFLS